MTSVKSNPSSETFPAATQQTVQDWLAFLTRKNYAQKHICFCHNRIIGFLRTLSPNKQYDLSQVNRHDVEQFITEAQRRGVQPQSINRYVSTILVFFDFLIEEGHVDHNPVLRRHRLAEPAPLPRALSEEEVSRFLTVLEDTMDKATFLLMLRSGLRGGEVRQLAVSDVCLSENMLIVRVGKKNRRGRVVYFSEDARDALGQWLKVRGSDEGLLFLRPQRNGQRVPLGIHYLQNRFRRCLKKAGLPMHYTVHCLRHTFATLLLNAGVPLTTIQELLGHDNIVITQRYAKLSDEKKRQDYFRAVSHMENHSHGTRGQLRVQEEVAA